MLSFIPLWKHSCVGCWMILPSSHVNIICSLLDKFGLTIGWNDSMRKIWPLFDLFNLMVSNTSAIICWLEASSDRPTIDPIKRSSDHSLHITEASSNIIACLPFKKPKERVEPVLWYICPNFVLLGKQCRNTKISLGIIETFFMEYYRTSYFKSACHRPTDNSVLNRLFSRDI
jgi:hypothetical protein